MKITDALLGEHGVLYRLLDYCGSQAAGWSLETARAAAGALQATLGSHAQLEETLLFTALDPFFPPGVGPLAVMRAEHQEIEGSVEKALTSDDVEIVRGLLVRIPELAREHFAKEEQVLFRMAEQQLGEEKLTELGQRWAEERGVAVG
jgi:iron-sulfur cluster repair protein YtfE (RIC family)